MSYNALENMRQINLEEYGIGNTVLIPELPYASRHFGREALAFIRESCTDLKFDTNDEKRKALKDSEGCSASANTIPYNMERDLDRLCLETAIGRFLESGSREDAFDIYFCYCEIFKPFGRGYNTTGILLEMLSEHETNASSLLMKHRDHYSHSVYVFLIGLAIYRNHDAIRSTYNQKYGLTEGPQAACHFLEHWGFTSLFHDIGYPFEIAHQQMKAYVCELFHGFNDENGFSPHVSYQLIDEFAHSELGDLNGLYAALITERLSEGYLNRTEATPSFLHEKLLAALKDRAIHNNPHGKDYLYMDHAYFSGLILAKVYIAQLSKSEAHVAIPASYKDCFTAIILHNSLFKFTIRSILNTSEPLHLNDGQPLAYLLMLCDELQCWDRASYGQSNRGNIYPFDFDLSFGNNDMQWTFYFDEIYKPAIDKEAAYKALLTEGYTKKSGAKRDGRSKFVDDIDEIISLADVLPLFDPDVSHPDKSNTINTALEYKAKKTGVYLSDSNYLNLYRFAIALNGRYCEAETETKMTKTEMARQFENNLSLEYKLSNIAQAKGFAKLLESIDCFYTDRPVEYEALTQFEDFELEVISKGEHDRWCEEKLALGWVFGDGHVGRLEGGRNDSIMRERTRVHHDLIPFEELPDKEKLKDSEPMEKLLTLIRELDGLTIYRMHSRER